MKSRLIGLCKQYGAEILKQSSRHVNGTDFGALFHGFGIFESIAALHAPGKTMEVNDTKTRLALPNLRFAAHIIARVQMRA